MHLLLNSGQQFISEKEITFGFTTPPPPPPPAPNLLLWQIDSFQRSSLFGKRESPLYVVIAHPPQVLLSGLLAPTRWTEVKRGKQMFCSQKKKKKKMTLVS